MKRCPQAPRRGAATVEFAFCVPLLVFLMVIAVDWARIFYYSVTITNAARNGALYGSDPIARNASTYANVTEAALAEASNLSPAPTVTSSTATDASGVPYYSVTVSWQFPLVTSYPGISNPTTLTRTCKMRVASTLPR